MTGVSHLKKAEQRLKTCEDCTCYREKDMVSTFWDSQGVLFTDFLIEQRTINEAYYSNLFED
jgi:hypothetical protein